MFQKGICLFFLLYGFVPTPSYAEGRMVKASLYAPSFEGRIMANGERYRGADPTITAHKKLPFGSKIRAKNLKNGRKWVVTVKDRGPFKKGRELDLSLAAAKKLGFADGVALLEIEVISIPN